MEKIYITHCSAKKENSFENTDEEIFPEKLYTATPTKRFIETCKNRNVNWAIFSDLYGIWFPEVSNRWYEKNPNNISEKEFEFLKNDFENKLKDFDEIYFYHNPGRFHSLYKRLLDNVAIKDKITLITHLSEIK